MACRTALPRCGWFSTFASAKDPKTLQKLQKLAKHLSEDLQDSNGGNEFSANIADTASEPAGKQPLPQFPLNLIPQDESEAESWVSPESGAADANGQSKSVQQRPESLYGSRWTAEEQARLIRVIDKCREFKLGTTSWVDVAEYFPGRTMFGCRDIYRRILDQNKINSIYEDTMLQTDLIVKSGDKRKVLSTKKEHQLLEKVVRKYGEERWSVIGKEMNALTGNKRQSSTYMQMWRFQVCPKALNAPRWDASKAEKLKMLAKEHGKDEIFLTYKFFPEYTPAIIKRMLQRIDTDTADVDYRPKSFWKKKMSTDAAAGNT
ncbi:hypothetical protein H4R99_004202 [Coemansia sp. RSA 1722]|nr:hypothetical protein LPJ57_004154 [Coemansia sp. RSA 486]KAJ2598202.1 hypothetical protein H4R99_004202 [Coemansia sp. RSA 1722]